MGRHESSALGSLRFKIAFPFALLVVITLLVLGIVAVDRGMKTLTVRAQESQSLLAYVVAHTLENLLRDKVTLLEGIAQLPSVKQMDAARIDEDIHDVRMMEKDVTSFIVLDADGRVVSFVDHPEHVGKSLAMRRYFQAVRDEGRPFISDSVLTLDKTITVAVSTPIVGHAGKPVGVLAATFDVHHQNFNQVIQDARIGSRGHAFLVDRRGIVICHPETRRSLEQQDFSRFLPVRETMSGKSGVATYDFEGMEMLAAFRPVDRSGWGVVVQQPLIDANVPAVQLRNIIAAVMIVSAIAAVIMGIMISTHISAPLSRIEEVARTIGSGNLEEPVPAVRGGEIGTLARTLEAMRLSLKESMAQRMQAYESLQASEERFRRIVDTAEEGVWVVDREWKTAYANSRLERMLGYGHGEMLGRHVWDFMDDEGRLVAQEKMAVRQSLARETYEFRLIRQDGTELWAMVSASPIESVSGQFDGALAMLTDITDRKMAQEELRQREEYYRGLFENAMDMVTVLRADGTMIFGSPSMERIVGYKPEELEGRDIFTQVHPEDQGPSRETLEHLVRNPDTLATAEFRFRHKNGSWRILEAVGKNLLQLPAMGAIVANMRDVTERRAVERQLRASLEEKEVLLREVHHRVKNNLQVISSLLDLHSGTVSNPEIAEVFSESRQRVKTMALIHEKLYRTGNFSAIVLNGYVEDLVHSIVQSNSPHSAVTAQVDVPPIPLSVNAAVPCGLIINELVSNCLKHAFVKGGAGHIRISVRSSENDALTLTVEDDGVGMPEHVDIDNTKTLGLTLVRVLVKQLNGTMEVQRGPGTRVRIAFSDET